MRYLVLLCASLVVIGVSFPVAARAEPFTGSQLDDMTEQLRRGGTYYNGNQPMPCGAVCTDLWLSEHRPIPNQPSSTQLHTELNRLRLRTGIVRGMHAFGRIGMRAIPVAGTVYAIYTIGDGINRRFFKIGYEQPEPAGDAATKFSSPAIDWSSTPRIYDIGEGDPAVLPADTWHFSFSWGGSFNVYFWGIFSQDSLCTYGGFPVPQGMVLESGLDYCGHGEEYGLAHGAWSETPPILDSGDVSDLPAGETVDGHMYEQPDAPFAEDRVQVETELSSNPEEYRLVIPWYWHQFEPENYPDPTTTEEHDHRCDLGEATYQNPGGNSTPPRLTAKDHIPYQTLGRPTGAPSAPDPYLRYGEAHWRDRSPGTSYIDDWGGWGWRHIRAKHGWTEGPGLTDESATRATLAAPASPPEEGDDHTSMTYRGPQLERNGVLCTRVVVVQYEPKAGDPDPYGIITSYERFDGEASG